MRNGRANWSARTTGKTTNSCSAKFSICTSSAPPITTSRGVRFRLAAHTIQSVLSFRHSGKRRNPWVLPFPCRIKHIIEIDSPSLRKPLGKSARVDSDAFRFSSNWQGHDGLTTITFTLQVLKDAVPADGV